VGAVDALDGAFDPFLLDLVFLTRIILEEEEDVRPFGSTAQSEEDISEALSTVLVMASGGY